MFSNKVIVVEIIKKIDCDVDLVHFLWTCKSIYQLRSSARYNHYPLGVVQARWSSVNNGETTKELTKEDEAVIRQLPCRFKSLSLKSAASFGVFSDYLQWRRDQQYEELDIEEISASLAFPMFFTNEMLASVPLTSLTLGMGLDVRSLTLPRTLTRLIIGERVSINYSKDTFPEGLRELEIESQLPDWFDWAILPPNLVKLVCHPTNSPVIGCLKENLESLKIQTTADSPLVLEPGVLPRSLKHLSVSYLGEFPHGSVRKGSFPRGIESIKLKSKVKGTLDRVLKKGILPDTLRSLKITVSNKLGKSFAEMLPKSLKHLSIILDEGKRNCPIGAGILPNSIESIELVRYDRKIYPGMLPETLKSLTLTHYTKTFEPGELPPGLEHLYLTKSYDGTLEKGNIPETLKTLRFSAPSCLSYSTNPSVKYLPASLEDLELVFPMSYEWENLVNLKRYNGGWSSRDRFPSSLESITTPAYPLTPDVFQRGGSLRKLDITFYIPSLLASNLVPEGVEELHIHFGGPVPYFKNGIFVEGASNVFPSTLSKIYIPAAFSHLITPSLVPFYCQVIKL